MAEERSPLVRGTCHVVAALMLVCAPLVSFWGGASLWRSMAAASWPQATATILHFELNVRSEGTHNSYEALVRYGYEVGGTHYENTAFRPTDAATQYESLARRLAERFPPGEKVPVWYNPADPSQAYLLVGFRPLYLLYVLPPWLFFVIALAWFVSLRRKRSGDKKTLDNRSYAALPGRLEPDRRRYVRYRGGSWLNRMAIRIACLLPWWLRFLPVLGRHRRHWQWTREVFRFGCLVPAILLDAQRGLVAVFSDLSFSTGLQFPVIKVVRIPLALLPPACRVAGTMFAAVSAYAQTPAGNAAGRWGDFTPVVVNLLVPRRLSCEDAKARLKPLAWEALRLGVAQLPKPLAEGLYAVEIPEEISENAY